MTKAPDIQELSGFGVDFRTVLSHQLQLVNDTVLTSKSGLFITYYLSSSMNFPCSFFTKATPSSRSSSGRISSSRLSTEPNET